MKIDIRNVDVYYINLEEHTDNNSKIQELLKQHNFKSVKRTPGIRVKGFNYNNYHQAVDHYMGVGMAQYNAFRQASKNLPALVLEDDVDIIPENACYELDIPDGTDAVYLGISAAGNAYGYDMKNGYARIFNTLAAHAILYINPVYLEELMHITKIALFDNQMPFDLPLAQLQSKYNIITPLKPMFYQSNNRQSANKWEGLTKTPIKIYGQNNSNTSAV